MVSQHAPREKGASLRSGPTPIFLPGSNRPVGFVSGQFFRKTIAGSKHILRTPRAIAFDRSTLDDAEKAGATHVSVTDSETGRTYIAPIATIQQHGFTVTRGYGNQVALTLDRYAIDGEQPQAERRAATTNQDCKELQLSLFEVAA
jgi:hypothetical protein